MTLTICSVVFRDQKALDLNWKLTTSLNPSAKPHWLVVQNLPLSPEGGEQWAREARERYQLIDGAPPDSNPAHAARKGSWQHAAGLNIGTASVRTRYVLFLDADFYIVRPNWIADVLDHMEKERLAFFGAPYHPFNLGKIRYFPCGICLFVDTDQVPLPSLDWTPERNAESMSELPLVDRWGGALFSLLGLKNRAGIGVSEDTGIRIYSKYLRNGAFRRDVVNPVLRAGELPLSRKARVLDFFLPDRFSYQPKAPNYCSAAGFRENGLFDATAANCEEYSWRKKPFAFHLRGSKNSLKSDTHALSRILEGIKIS